MENRDLIIQTSISTLKASIGSIPVIGGALNEYLFEVRSRLKQDRINKFIESFASYLTNLKSVKLDISQVENEEFGDFFEELLSKVSKTNSESKRDAFKKILAKQIICPLDFDYASLILDTIGCLHEKQIPILYRLYEESYYSITDDKGILHLKQVELKKLYEQRDKAFINSTYRENSNDDPIVKNLQSQVSSLEDEVYSLKERIGEQSDNKRPIEKSKEEKILLQDLCNKGLAFDNSLKYASEPLNYIRISLLGIDIIKSIK